jgi:predicted metal-dependent hydrolase
VIRDTVMNDERLNQIFKQVHKTHFPGRLRKVQARFYPYRSLRHTVEWNSIRINAKVSVLFTQAPVYIIEALAILLLSRVYRKKVDAQIRTLYNSYSRQIPHKKQTRKIKYRSSGKYFDLSVLLNRLNSRYFKNELEISNIGWSQKRSYTRLGFYDNSRNLIVISKIFDSSLVPLKVVEYLVYHEMLHVKHPEKQINGRRRIHPPEFRADERSFPEFDDIQRWIKTNLRRLL